MKLKIRNIFNKSSRSHENEKVKDNPPGEASAAGTPHSIDAIVPDGNAAVTAGDEIISQEADLAEPPRLKVPLYVKILYIIAGVCVLIYAAAVIWEPFADFYTRYPGALTRAVLAHLTNWIPFSLAEALVLMLPVIIFFLMRTAVKKYSDSWHNTWVYVAIIFSYASVFFSIFTLGFGTGYQASTVDKKLGLDRQNISSEDLYRTASILVDRINEDIDEIMFLDKDFSVMPYTIAEMNDKLLKAYDKICEKYDFIQKLNSRVKPVFLSELMSYSHITGIYTFFSGEANINVAFPDYTMPYTAAHELAHQRGISREDEANFIAFLVCIESDDPYIRYSGYLNLYEYVASDLYKADAALYSKVRSELDSKAIYEMRAFSAFFDKYRHSTAAKVSGAVNDTYQKIQGTPGIISYDMVVELVVAYYRNAK